MYTFLIILVTIIWGSTFFIIKDTIENVNEFFIVFGRTFIASVAMLLYILKKRPRALINKNSIIYGFIIGSLLGLTYISQTIGLKFTSSGHSAFITGAAVIVVPFLSYFLLKTKLTFIKISAFVIVFIGLFFLTYDLETIINRGDLITLITTISLAFHIILSARYVNKSDVLGLVFYQFLAATIISLTGFLATSNGIPNLDSNSTNAILYLGFIGTLFCYFISVWVMKYVSPLKVSIIFSLEPVFAALFAFAFANEVLATKEIVGALLILAGIITYQLLEKKRPAKKLSTGQP